MARDVPQRAPLGRVAPHLSPSDFGRNRGGELERVFGGRRFSQLYFAGVAHFAHPGGMVGAWLLIRYWQGRPPFRRY